MDNAFTFFPGKGIYTTPNSGLDPIIPIYDREKAENIFSAFSHMAFGKKNLADRYEKDTLEHAKILLDLHGEVSPRMSQKFINLFPQLLFDGAINNKDTRISFRSEEVSWDIIESQLCQQGYKLKKREYLNGLLDGLVSVYTVSHSDTGVIAEGKGFTDEQARYSALAEAVERLYSRPQNSDQIILGSQKILFQDTKTRLQITSGPRDTFSKDTVTEWVPAMNILDNEAVFLPAEVSYFKYVPRNIRLKLFSLYHTTGLATGSSVEEAVLSGIFEIMERDAYWITMRCKLNHPDINFRSVKNLNQKVPEILAKMEKSGFKIYLKDMSLDWGVPIAHAVLVDTQRRIPSFSHGSGAAFDWATAISRAVAEVVQMHSGMMDFVSMPANWERIVSAGDVLGRGELAWSDPLFQIHINHLSIKGGGKFNSSLCLARPKELINILKDKKYSAIATNLNKVNGLNVVRTYIPEATQPDERLERIGKRMNDFRVKNGERGFYCDPILT